MDEYSEEAGAILSALECQAEKDGLIYLSGWMARKFKNIHPSLIKNCDSSNNDDWISRLSYGKLTRPSDTLIEEIEKINREYKLYHPMFGFVKGKNVNKNFVNKIQEKISLPADVITAYVRLRTFIRIKYLNLHKKKINKSKISNKTKKSKKMKKIVN